MTKDTIDARNRAGLHDWCDAARGLSRIAGRWKLSLLTRLGAGPVSLPLLAAHLPQASGRVLTRALRQMQADGLIAREGGGHGVTYHLTPAGRGMLGVVHALADWQRQHP